jgi:hypothetical protein
MLERGASHQTVRGASTGRSGKRANRALDLPASEHTRLPPRPAQPSILPRFTPHSVSFPLFLGFLIATWRLPCRLAARRNPLVPHISGRAFATRRVGGMEHPARAKKSASRASMARHTPSCRRSGKTEKNFRFHVLFLGRFSTIGIGTYSHLSSRSWHPRCHAHGPAGPASSRTGKRNLYAARERAAGAPSLVRPCDGLVFPRNPQAVRTVMVPFPLGCPGGFG